MKFLHTSLMSGLLLTSAVLACHAQNAVRQDSAPMPGVRPPSVPLVTHDPYFSVWSSSERLSETATKHWSNRTQALSSLVRIDGQTYRLLGDTPQSALALNQIGLQVTPTRTIASFAGAGVRLNLTFTSPMLPEDLEMMSRPVTYVTWEVMSIDGKNHDVSLYLDGSAALSVNETDQVVKGSREKMGSVSAIKIGTVAQPVLGKRGDDLRIDWGYFYLAAAGQKARLMLAPNAACEAAFASKTTVSPDMTSALSVKDSDLVAALSFDLGRVGSRVQSRVAMLAYDDLFSIQYMKTNLRPYWRRNGMDASGLLRDSAARFEATMARCRAFDAQLDATNTRLGGQKFARLAALAHRQALAAQKIVADANGQPLSFSKENFSNGCIATVDLIYPAGPQMLALSPSLLKASLQPLMDYATSPRWKFPFAPHDLGTYPLANGQVYGGGERTEENQMPVEETGNLLVLLAALSKLEGNTSYSDPFWPKMTQWAEYLADKGFDPESQLSTDDFSGHLAHNVNLSAKAIMGLGAYSQMAAMRKDAASAKKYRDLAQQFANQWMKEADDGTHFRLAFDRPGTWSQKYNLVWDRILNLNLFPQSVYEKEMAFYRTKMAPYGLPLDNRARYTKLDWEIWTATLTGKRADFDVIMNPIHDWISATPTRVPLTDWYDTDNAKQVGFQARSVVGGVFLPLLQDAQTWRQWAARDRNRPANWAPIPVLPEVIESLSAPSAQNAPVQWRYTTQNPGDNWFAANFNDGAWKTGEAGFGSPGTPGITQRTLWNTPDIWLRRNFTLSANDLIGSDWYLYGFHDEDAQIYVNGKLVARLGGFVASYDTLAKLPKGVLKEGVNSFAIQVHQSSGGQGVDLGLARVK